MYSEHFSTEETEKKFQDLKKISEDSVIKCLQKNHWNAKDFDILISPTAQNHLEAMAQKAKKLTQKRFGKVMQLFIPMYLSNECFNSCTYCGFSMEHNYTRTTLTKDEILSEGRILKEKGFQHILLLTGEAPGTVGTPYIAEAIRLLTPLFPSIGIEVQPLSEKDYKHIITMGADNLTLYQETYHTETYKKIHKKGKKRNFNFRLNSVDAGGKAGFYRITIGALLGLYHWQYDAIALRDHLVYLSKRYWQTKFGVSFPRIQKMGGDFTPEHHTSDKDFAQLILAFRLCFPDTPITLSTRESSQLRDKLIHLGITTMSAESHTEPGGYSGKKSTQQFEISDTRSITEIKSLLTREGFEPVMKDWDRL